MQDYVRDLIETVDEAGPRLLALGDAENARRPAPGKWSPREIVGHLIDSASNNHRRFVVAPSGAHLVFDGYDQDEWVAAGHYQDAPWPELVTLWAAFNRHLSRVMASASIDDLTRPRARHNLHELAWQPIAADRPATLDEFMRDYVAHLQHHLRQLLGDDWRATRRPEREVLRPEP
jgi:hypothetical protein